MLSFWVSAKVATNGRGYEQLGTTWTRTYHPLPSSQARATHAQPLKPKLLMSPC